MTEKKTVARNAALMMGSQAGTWGMALLLTIFMPRYLGPAAMGKFHFASSVWAILGMLAGLGMDTYLTKEAARRPQQVPSLVWSSALLRFIFFLLSMGGLTVYLQVFAYPQDTRQVAYIVGLSSLGWLLISVVQSILIGFEKMESISLGNIAGRVTATLISILVLLLGQGVVAVAAVNILGAAVTLAIEYRFLSRLVKIPVRISRAELLEQMLRLAKGGLPYLLSGIILVVYMQFDFLIISLLVDDRSVGWYGVADQLFGTFLFVPTVLMTAVFPLLSRMFVSDTQRLVQVTRKSFDLLVLLSIPIGLGVVVAAQPAVQLLYGTAFAPTSAILSLMGIVIILTYLNVFIGQYLISIDRQNQWTWVMAAATLLTLPLDLWLIPWCAQAFDNGGLGGALSFIITEGGMLLAGLLLMPAGTLRRANLWLALRALFAGLLMLVVTAWVASFPLPEALRLALIVLTGALVYLLAAFLLRLFAPEDLALVRGTLSAFRFPRSAARSPLSAVPSPLSAGRDPLSASDTRRGAAGVLGNDEGSDSPIAPPTSSDSAPRPADSDQPSSESGQRTADSGKRSSDSGKRSSP